MGIISEVTTKQPEMRLIFSAETIASKVSELARQISVDYRGRELVLVGVLKGSFIFLADLVRQLAIPVEIDFVRLASYGSRTTSSGKVRILADVQSDLRNRDVLIVEDIVDSGFSMAFLRDHLLSHKPRSLKICSLLDKAECRSIAVPLDYVILKVRKGFLVGYGLDCNEAHRHLPDICELVL